MEIVLVNDNNPDQDCRKSISEAVKSYPSIVYVPLEKNSGAQVVRNSGIKAAHEKFVVFLDDDEWLPNKIEEQIALIEEGVGLVYCKGFIFIEVGTYPVSNMRTTEAVKVVENSQRDINIAFMNELAMFFDRMDIDANEVVDCMNIKQNALGFRQGLVGGHCIGVDPYYFTYEAEKLGYHFQIILNGRMGTYVADQAVKKMIEAGQAPKKSKVVILGLTFKENCPDTRNSKVDDIIKQLNTYGIEPTGVDPWERERDAMREYGVQFKKM